MNRFDEEMKLEIGINRIDKSQITTVNLLQNSEGYSVVTMVT